MDSYIVCEARANHSRIHVKICQFRCEEADSCQAFQDFMRAHVAEGAVKSPDAASLPQGTDVPQTLA